MKKKKIFKDPFRSGLSFISGIALLLSAQLQAQVTPQFIDSTSDGANGDGRYTFTTTGNLRFKMLNGPGVKKQSIMFDEAGTTTTTTTTTTKTISKWNIQVQMRAMELHMTALEIIFPFGAVL